MAEAGVIPPARKARILIIDDDEAFVEIGKLTLEQAGYEVFSAAGGMDALEKIRMEGRPDLVLLDYMMPGIDGIKALQILENFVISTKVPVIFCSAVSDRKVITQALIRGARDYLIKPFTPAELLETLATHLRSPSIA